MIKHLYDIFAKSWYIGGSIYFISDPHFNDPETWKIKKSEIWKEAQGDEIKEQRFLQYVTEWSKLQIKEINKVCSKKDTLVILGDIGDLSYVKLIRAGKKILIMGNHDAGAEKYKRITSWKKIPVINYLNGKTPNDLCELSKEEEELYYSQAKLKALEEIKKDADFKFLSNNIEHEFEEPFMSWAAYYDNGLFDEVYEGSLQIGPKLLLSHEPVYYPYCLNIHGHTHGSHTPGKYYEYIDKHNDEKYRFYSVISEKIDYTPISLKEIVEGHMKDIPDIHRMTIDRANSVKKLLLAQYGEIDKSSPEYKEAYKKMRSIIKKEPEVE